MERHEIKATELGFTRTLTSKLAGGTPEQNARMVESVLRGEPGARRDVVLLNAGAALLVAGVVEKLEEGIDRAGLTIDAGLGDRAAGQAARGAAGVRCGQAAAATEGAPRMTLAARPRSRPGASSTRSPRAGGPTSPPSSTPSAATGSGRRSLRAPAPRPVVVALAAPGLHLIAEVKRRSPSAGEIAASDDAVARARAYAAGGASVISVLCEPHWFGGSVDDLRAVRAAVSDPRARQGLRRRSPAARSPPGCRGRPRAAPRGPPPAGPAGQARGAGARPRARAAGGGARRARDRGGAGDRCAADRDQQPRPADAGRRPGAGRAAPGPDPGRPARRSPSRACATRRPSLAGGRPGSTPRSSARP